MNPLGPLFPPALTWSGGQVWPGSSTLLSAPRPGQQYQQHLHAVGRKVCLHLREPALEPRHGLHQQVSQSRARGNRTELNGRICCSGRAGVWPQMWN